MMDLIGHVTVHPPAAILSVIVIVVNRIAVEKNAEMMDAEVAVDHVANLVHIAVALAMKRVLVEYVGVHMRLAPLQLQLVVSLKELK